MRQALAAFFGIPSGIKDHEEDQRHRIKGLFQAKNHIQHIAHSDELDDRAANADNDLFSSCKCSW